jgi:hypothetical protein
MREEEESALPKAGRTGYKTRITAELDQDRRIEILT